MEFDPERLAHLLSQCWSLETSSKWTADNPAAGQCNVTALLVHRVVGGEIMKTLLPEGWHFYNRIDGRRYDFTDRQFSAPISYHDVPASRADAEQGASPDQIQALQAAFEAVVNEAARSGLAGT